MHATYFSTSSIAAFLLVSLRDRSIGRHCGSSPSSCGHVGREGLLRQGPELNLEPVEHYPKAYLYLAARKRWHRSDPISNVVGALANQLA
jgi:hypothetical protein